MPLIVSPRPLLLRSEFYRELAALLGAGVPLLQALQHVRLHPPSPDYAGSLALAQAAIEAGSSFTESLRARGPWLPEFDLALIEAGENSGRLVESCRLLADHYAERARLLRTLLTQLAYPVFLLHFAVLIFPTSRLVGLVWHGELGSFLAQKAAVLIPLYGTAAALVWAFQGRRAESWAARREQLVRAIPLLGTAVREQALANLAGALEALISAGVGVPRAWEMATAASGSAVLVRTVSSWRARIEAGELPSELVGRNDAFPAVFANLYHTGELSGHLDEELRHLHRYFQESATLHLRNFVRGASMIFYLLVVGIVAWQVVSFWSRYYGGLLRGVGLE